MPRRRLLVPVLLAVLAVCVPGCSSSNSDNTSNPELQVPDVPPSPRTTQSPIPPGK